MQGVYFKQLMSWLTMNSFMGLLSGKGPELRPKEVILSFPPTSGNVPATTLRGCSSFHCLSVPSPQILSMQLSKFGSHKLYESPCSWEMTDLGLSSPRPKCRCSGQHDYLWCISTTNVGTVAHLAYTR